MSILLSTAYFPNIQYITKFFQPTEKVIELYETYPKQTYRNRCNILTANGILPLSVPVQKNFHTLTKDIKIDYSENWQRNHSTAIKSAYKNSPFYDYYYYKFEKFFTTKEVFLIDLNTNILNTILDIFKVDIATYSFTVDYIADGEKYIDLRNAISPKKSQNMQDANFNLKPYIQVFADRFQFVPNLSCLDLIFNVGNESVSKIKECIGI